MSCLAFTNTMWLRTKKSQPPRVFLAVVVVMTSIIMELLIQTTELTLSRLKLGNSCNIKACVDEVNLEASKQSPTNTSYSVLVTTPDTAFCTANHIIILPDLRVDNLPRNHPDIKAREILSQTSISPTRCSLIINNSSISSTGTNLQSNQLVTIYLSVVSTPISFGTSFVVVAE